MGAPEASDVRTFTAYLARHEKKSLLRVLTCGSVDDGKSTLIGRLLYDAKLLLEDQLASLEKDSKRYGTVGQDVDFALLVDGLEAEREQGITIDVAYRFLATEKRKFVVADTPGHEQYTRNMATGASNSDLAVILVDARHGIVTQTRRHSFIAALLGIRHVVLAINKVDLVNYSEEVCRAIAAEYRTFAADLGFESLQPIPLSARFGDNVFSRGTNIDWYVGPTLIEYLDTVEVEEDLRAKPFRMPVQWVNRPDLDFRGFLGTIVSGVIRSGDPIVVANSGRASTVKSIVTYDGELEEAGAGQAVTLTLNDEIDISRGDMLSAVNDRPEVSDQFSAHLIWMADDELLPGRSYLLKLGTKLVPAQVTNLKYKIDVNSFSRLAAKSLILNDVAVVNIALSEPIAFEPYTDCHQTGAFILIDRISNLTVGAGMVDFVLGRATDIHWQAIDVSKASRAAVKRQKPVVLWFTGLSGAGKSTIANLVEKRLHLLGRHTFILDGDNVRHGLNKDLGFSDADRVENIRRISETAKLFVEAGLIVLVSFISPFRSERRLARELMEGGEFIEIYVATSLEVAETRDPKGLYKKARNGEIQHFTGISSPYEPPEHAELTLDTVAFSAEQLAEQIVKWLDERGYLVTDDVAV